MYKLSKEHIEEIAVHQVKDVLLGIPGITSNLKEKDKDPSIDGLIAVNTNKNSKKDNITNIPVQIKGTTKKYKNKKCIKKPVALKDLKYYITNTRGVIYFIVVMDSSGNNTTIYFNALLPYDLRMITKNCQTATKSLSFVPFPENKNDIYDLLVSFIDNSRKQINYLGFNNEFSIDKILDKSKNINYVLPNLNLQISNTINIVPKTNLDRYVYIKNDLNEFYVAEKIDNFSFKSMSRINNIKCGKCDYDVEIKILPDKTLLFGGFIINLNGNKFEYKYTGNFHERYRDMKLITELLNDNYMEIEDVIRFKIKFHESELKHHKQHLENLKSHVNILDDYNINYDWDPYLLSNEDLSGLYMLTQKLEKDNLGSFDPNKYKSEIKFIHFKDFVVGIIYINKGNNEYEVKDLLNPNYFFYVNSENNKCQYRLPPFLMLSAYQYKLLLNINPELFKQSIINHIDNTSSYTLLLHQLDTMLTAIDMGAICSCKLYLCCEILAEFLYENNKQDNYYLYLLQVKKRKRILTEQEKEKISSIFISCQDSYTKVCCSILLDNPKHTTQACINKLDKSEKEKFEYDSISNLYNNGVVNLQEST